MLIPKPAALGIFCTRRILGSNLKSAFRGRHPLTGIAVPIARRVLLPQRRYLPRQRFKLREEQRME
jgi:hypothetical protein